MEPYVLGKSSNLPGHRQGFGSKFSAISCSHVFLYLTAVQYFISCFYRVHVGPSCVRFKHVMRERSHKPSHTILFREREIVNRNVRSHLDSAYSTKE